jgi:uncharacterized membrane protein
VDPAVRQQTCLGSSPRRSAVPSGAILVVVLSLLVSAGCGGGGTGTNGGGPPPPPQPTFTTIDVAGAGTGSEQGTFATFVNESDDVVGYIIDPNNLFHGFVQTAAPAITTIDAPGAGTAAGYGTFTTGINGPGEVIGYFVAPTGFFHSYMISSGGTMTEFDPPNASGSSALCVNDNGTIAGGVIDINGNHGYVRTSDGTYTLIDPTGDATQVSEVIPRQINASGDVAGYYEDLSGVFHGFQWQANGTVTLLNAPGAGTAQGEGTEMLGINASGEMIGAIAVGVVNNVSTTHSVVLSAGGTFTVFDPPQSGAHSSLTEGINDAGVVVGEYRDASLVRHGYLLNADGTYTSFDAPNAAQLPLSAVNLGTVPRSINNFGEIVGLYSDTAGVRHGFIRTP